VAGAGELHLHGMLELAELEAAAERYEEAASRLRALRAELETAPAAPEELRKQAAYRLAVCEYRLDRFDAASELFESFLAAFPDSDLEASARLLCGESHFKTGSHKLAAGHLRRVVEKHPEDEGYGPALLRLGECLAVLQDWPASEKAYRRYLERIDESDQRFQAQFGVGWALENQDMRDEAIEAYAVVIEEHRGPTAARAQFQIGECLFAMERYDEAVRNLMKVDILYAYPEWSAAALYEAGRCFQKLSDPVQARKQFETVQRDYGDTEWSRLAGQRLEELARTTLPGRGT
jgi:TolA-binding protein